MQTPQIYLASKSPRRRELLEQIGLRYHLLLPEVDEIPRAKEAPELFVERLALEKARAGFALIETGPVWPVLGADTVVVLDGEILGKPAHREDAEDMLRKLSGREHRVMSAVAVTDGKHEAARLSVSRVCFRELSRAERTAYIDSGEPDDKAGGYAIQGKAALFIERLEGSYSGVMGLPLFETGELLAEFGVQCLRAAV